MIATNPKPTITFRDPVTGAVYEIPRKPITTIDADVRERWVVNIVVPQEQARALVPLPWLKPIPARGLGIISLCAIFMRHAAPPWAPLKVGPPSHNCALRVACTDTRDGTQAVWVDHRYTDCQLARVLPYVGFPPVIPALRIVRDERTLALHTGTIDCVIEADDDAPLPHAFATAEDFEVYFGAGIRSYGPAARRDAYTVVDLEKRSTNHFIHRADRRALLRIGAQAQLADGVYCTRDGTYRWRYLGLVDEHGRPLERAGTLAKLPR